MTKALEVEPTEIANISEIEAEVPPGFNDGDCGHEYDRGAILVPSSSPEEGDGKAMSECIQDSEFQKSSCCKYCHCPSYQFALVLLVRILFVITILVVLSIYLWNVAKQMTLEADDSYPSPTPAPAPTPTGDNNNTIIPLSAAEVALHNATSDCWTIYYDSVYDMTSYAQRHPGGPHWIYEVCGINGTEDYMEHHRKSVLRLATSYLLGDIAG